MGLCFSDCWSDNHYDSYYNYNNYNKNKINNSTGICYKCKDRFKIQCGGFSERRSCRCHNFDNTGFCLDCHEYKQEVGYTCYHVKKFSIF